MQIDTVGTYIGEVVESAISTSRNGFPQWTPRLKAVKKYIETASELEHYKLTEPGYIDYAQFDEEIVAYLVLYGAKDGADPTPTLNYEQAQLATGWDGTDFEGLNAAVGKQILFRVEERTYNDKTGLQVNWIDNVDASPTKTLKAMDSAAIKDLNAKFLKGVAKKAAPAKPAKPAAPTTAKPAAKTTAPAEPKGEVKVPTAKKTPPAKKTETAAPLDEPGLLSAETTQLEGWDYVNEHKGGNDDKTIEDAWLAACKEVGGNTDQDAFTGLMWAKVRDTVIKDLALS